MRRGAVTAIIGAVLLLVLGGPAAADDRIDLRTTFFYEPGQNGSRVRSLSPSVNASKDLSKDITLSVGYEADIVSGASPQIFKVDATTGATPFSDIRHSPHGGITLRSGNAQLGFAYAYSRENDYHSHVGTVSGKVDLFGKNTTLGFSYSHNFDSVCDSANRSAGNDLLRRRALAGSQLCFGSSPDIVSRDLAIDSFELTVSQVLTPILLIQGGGALQVAQGFQSSPYREVQLQFQAAQEHIPDVRYRLAGFLRMALYLKPIRGSVQLFGRIYRDSWDIYAGTGEVVYSQYLGTPNFLVRGRFRYYRQTGAVFYRDADGYASFGSVGQYFTGDRELSPFESYLGGGRISYINSAGTGGKLLRLFQGLEFSMRGDYIAYRALTPLAPNRDRKQAIILGAGIDLSY